MIQITDIRIVRSLAGIERSLSILAEVAKSDKDLKKQLIDNMNTFEEKLKELKENPFGLK